MVLTQDMKLALNALTEGVILTNREGDVLYCNDAYLRSCGQHLADVEGRYIRQVQPGAMLPWVIESGKPLLGVPQAPGEEPAFSNLYPVRNGEGIIVGGITLITYLKDAAFFQEKQAALDRALQTLRLRLQQNNGAGMAFEQIIAGSTVTKRLKQQAKKLAKTEAPLLLEGPPGSGKAAYAQAIHNGSQRKNGPFIAVDCTAYKKQALEARLFGYEEGAYAAAKGRGHSGVFEAATGGTVYLDQVSALPPALQARLVLLLQEKSLRRMGGAKEIPVDIRLVCSCTPPGLDHRVKEGLFRKDLALLLSGFTLALPPLSQRPEDIPLLTEALLQPISRSIKRTVTVDASVMDLFIHYSWPGNLAELQGVLAAAASQCGGVILPEHLPGAIQQFASDGRSLAERVRVFEQQQIAAALQLHGNTVEGKKAAAKTLGISLASLYNKLNL